MAQRSASYTYGEVLSIAASNYSRGNEDAKAAYLCSLATNLIWMQYDWRESLAVLPPFYLIPDAQDHGAPCVSIPSDFMGLRTCTLTRTTTSPPIHYPIHPQKNLELTHIHDIPQSISYNPATDSIRVFPRVPFNLSCPEWLITGEYKTRPAKVTPATMATLLLPFDDIYLNVWVEAIKWAAFTITSDQRAGQVAMQNGMKSYSGQLAIAMAAISSMASNEGLELGDPSIHPEEPLISTSSMWNTGAYGLLS